MNGYREIEAKDYNGVALEITRLTNWYVYKAFGNKFFPGAVSMEFSVDGNSDDEGGMNYHVYGIEAYDAEDNEVEPKEYTDEELGLFGECPSHEENYEEWARWYDVRNSNNYEACLYELPVDKDCYNLVVDLVTPPSEKYKIFVREE
jgi:hypothetical protein